MSQHKFLNKLSKPITSAIGVLTFMTLCQASQTQIVQPTITSNQRHLEAEIVILQQDLLRRLSAGNSTLKRDATTSDPNKGQITSVNDQKVKKIALTVFGATSQSETLPQIVQEQTRVGILRQAQSSESSNLGQQTGDTDTGTTTTSTGGDSTGGATGDNTGGTTGDNTGGATGDNAGGTTGNNTGGTTGDNTGGTTGENTGGTTGDNTGGTTGNNTGGTTGDNTGGTTTSGTDAEAKIPLPVRAPEKETFSLLGLIIGCGAAFVTLVWIGVIWRACQGSKSRVTQIPEDETIELQHEKNTDNQKIKEQASVRGLIQMPEQDSEMLFWKKEPADEVRPTSVQLDPETAGLSLKQANASWPPESQTAGSRVFSAQQRTNLQSESLISPVKSESFISPKTGGRESQANLETNSQTHQTMLPSIYVKRSFGIGSQIQDMPDFEDALEEEQTGKR